MKINSKTVRIMCKIVTILCIIGVIWVIGSLLIEFLFYPASTLDIEYAEVPKSTNLIITIKCLINHFYLLVAFVLTGVFTHVLGKIIGR